MGLELRTNETLLCKAEPAKIIDKGDLLRLWQQTGKFAGSGGASECSRSQVGSESTASPRLQPEEDLTPSSELLWNPLDLNACSFPSGPEEGADLEWDPLGLKESGHFDSVQPLESVLEESVLDGEVSFDTQKFLSKPPGLEDCGEGGDNLADLWSRSTTGSDLTREHELSSNEMLAAEMAAILDLIQTGGEPVVPEVNPKRSMLPAEFPGFLVRGSPSWPCPAGNPFLTFAQPQLHNFCPWCGFARICSHRFCPQCGVMYPDLANTSDLGEAMDFLSNYLGKPY